MITYNTNYIRHCLGYNLNDKHSKYPPHNLIIKDDENYLMEFAVAGFSKESITVSKDNDVLIIKGEIKIDRLDLTDETIYAHHGISLKPFTREYQLGNYIDVENVSIVDGILRIELKRIVPDEKKPKVFEIK